MNVSRNEVLDIFKVLNDSQIEYALLRNIGNELPDSFAGNKDIDLIINPVSKKDFKKAIMMAGFKEVKHPWNFANNFVFLYNMDKLEFYVKGNLHLDICYQLCCRSVNNGEWMPVDQLIQNSVWKNRKRNELFPWFELCKEDQFVHLLTRCIFDKKQFPTGYIEEINKLVETVDEEGIIERLNLVFFKFTPILLDLIRKKSFDTIVSAYLTFTNY